MGFEEKILDTLTNIETSLKRIEQSLNAETQSEVIKEAVFQALTGKKANPSP